MKKSMLFSLIGAIIIVTTAVVIVAVKKPMSSSSDNAETSAMDTKPAGKKMAFSQFAKQGGTYKCTVNQYINGDFSISTKATVYLHNGNMRGDYDTTVQGTNVRGSIIVKDGYSYVWSSMSPMGFKMAVKETTSDGTQTSTSGAISWNADQIGDYDCTAWNYDASLFVTPSSITFSQLPS